VPVGDYSELIDFLHHITSKTTSGPAFVISLDTTFSVVATSNEWSFSLARISHQDHGSRHRIRVSKRRSGAKIVAIAKV
jgi:hypothetical protein